MKEHTRALAHIEKISQIDKIVGADAIEMVHVLGWKCIAKIGEFNVGDYCVYFEIDSKLPEKEWSSFMESKGYKVKTMKLSKFGVISQGLALPFSAFNGISLPEKEGEDVTKLLGVTYYNAEDNARKSTVDRNSMYLPMQSRHKKLFKTKFGKWMMRREWGRRIMFFFFGKKKDKPKGFPSFVSKTDEERIENQPWRLGDGKIYLLTEKLDGTSCTYALERKPFGRFEFYVCSRNVRQKDENQKCYHDHNIYWDMAFKYDIKSFLKKYLEENKDCKWVCIQGEGVGSVQGNPLKLDADDLYVYNFIDSKNGRWSSLSGKEYLEKHGFKWVPILCESTLPDTMDEMKEIADGKSVINPNVLREGIVYRSLDGKDSFKNVSTQYLLKEGKGKL